ncbi:MAG: short chain dehydrogenase [Nitrospira sp.]|nr:short chain dehydrogenase [Nitrospira sp.]MDH4304793.1 short chain dehydrogenase [Nitrospira sp.]MDH5194229.1 short chain dehydrogenase [Nitrospira sp.]
MRVIVIGGTGTIGSAVVAALSARHEVVTVGRTRGDFQVDLASAESIRAMFQSVGKFDAVISAAGQAKFGSLDELTDADYLFSFSNKLMGQANLVRIGRQLIADGGSFTLTSGVLSREPIKGSASISMVNAGLEGFARAAALELPRGVRVNVVSPPWVTETLIARKVDPSKGMPAAVVAKAYLASVEGTMTGQTLDPRKLAGQ